MVLITEKKRLRQEMKEIMSFVANKSERSEHLLQTILDRKLLQGVRTVSTFITLGDEVDTLPLVEYCWNNGITVTVPEFDHQHRPEFVLRKWSKSDHLYETQYGIFHPKNSRTLPLQKIDLIFVPGMAFTMNGQRLGRGKGFYDRLLSHFTGQTVGLCFKEQIKERIPVGEKDVKVQSVVTC